MDFKQNNNEENKNFYQKIATNSQNNGSHISCEYFETLQHKAGIQSNRKNGYYVKPMEREYCQNTNDNVQQNEQQESTEKGPSIDDIFCFDEEIIKLNEQSYSNDSFSDLSENDFYNDFFASDENIDNEETNRQSYQQSLREVQQQMVYNRTSNYANNIKNSISNSLNQPIYNNSQTSESEENKKMFILIGIIGCIVVLLICCIILGSILSDNANKKEKMNNNNKVVINDIDINQEEPNTTSEIVMKENSILCFSLNDVNIYENKNLNNVIGTLNKNTLVSIQKDCITTNSCKYSEGYLETNKLYYYNGSIDEFNNETIKFFEDYANTHSTLDIEFKNLISVNEEKDIQEENNETIKSDILIELGTDGNDVVKTDQYIINFDTSDENFSLLGNLGDKINGNSINNVEQTTTQKETQKTIELYNGQKYANLIINSVGINGSLHYGASQNNIDLYDTCSSESFGVPGSGRAILIGGHNTNSLKDLHNVKNGDIVTISTSYGTFEYEVFYTGIGKIVEENALASDYLKDIETGKEIFSINESEEILGIYTCYQNPNDDVTPTPYRFAIKAIKVGSRADTQFK